MNPGTRIYEPLSGLSGVASAGTPSILIPTDRRHIMNKVFCSATIGGVATTDPTAIIDTVTHKIGTKVIREETAADIVAWAKHNKLPALASSALGLYYAEPPRASVNDEVVTAWDTFGMSKNFELKFKLKSGLVNPSLRVTNVYDSQVMMDPTGKSRVLQIVKRSTSTHNLGSVGDIIIRETDLPITAIYLKPSGANTIDHVKVTVNDTQVIHDLDRAENNEFLADYNYDTTAFGYVVRFDVERQIMRRLEGIRSLVLKVTSSAAQSVDVILEQVAPDYI